MNNQPCNQYFEDGWCIKGIYCPYDHDIYAKEIKEVDFFFNWEYIKIINNLKKEEIKLKPTLEEEQERIRIQREKREKENQKKRKKEIEEIFSKTKKEKVERVLDDNILKSLDVSFNHKKVILESSVKEKQKEEERIEIKEKEEKYGYINFEKPQIPFSLHYEIPHNQRQKSLNMFIESFSKIYKDRKRIVLESLETENEIYSKYKTKTAYQMSVRDKLKELKK